MSRFEKSKILAASVVVGALGVSGAAHAGNPFTAMDLASGYQLAAADAEGKCGEGKCGEMTMPAKGGVKDGAGTRNAEGKCGEGMCGEGKCGNQHDAAKAAEGKCGEGKCGEGMCGAQAHDGQEGGNAGAADGASKAAEGSCGDMGSKKAP